VIAAKKRSRLGEGAEEAGWNGVYLRESIQLSGPPFLFLIPEAP